MSTICIANVSSVQKPPYQFLMFSTGPSGVARFAAMYAMIVNNTANRNGFGTHFSDQLAIRCPIACTRLRDVAIERRLYRVVIKPWVEVTWRPFSVNISYGEWSYTDRASGRFERLSCAFDRGSRPPRTV
jgi:hypothetical protein